MLSDTSSEKILQSFREIKSELVADIETYEKVNIYKIVLKEARSMQLG